MFKEYAEYKDFNHLRGRVDALSISLRDLRTELQVERKHKLYFQYGKSKLKDRMKREIMEEMANSVPSLGQCEFKDPDRRSGERRGKK